MKRKRKNEEDTVWQPPWENHMNILLAALIALQPIWLLVKFESERLVLNVLLFVMKSVGLVSLAAVIATFLTALIVGVAYTITEVEFTKSDIDALKLLSALALIVLSALVLILMEMG